MNSDRADGHPTIDCHVHVFTLAMPLREGAWRRPATEASPAKLRETLQAYGVRRAVIAASSLHGDNDYVLSLTEADPDFKATVIVDPDTSLDEMAEMKARGAVGVRFQWRNVPEPPDLSSRVYQGLLRRIGSLGWHVQIHDDARRLAGPIAIIQDAGIDLVIDHFGRPGGRDDLGFAAVLSALQRRQTWLKISASFRLDSPSLDHMLVSDIMHVAGTDRLLWGSDWPFVGYESAMNYGKALAAYMGAVSETQIREQIDANARALYFRDATA